MSNSHVNNKELSKYIEKVNSSPKSRAYLDILPLLQSINQSKTTNSPISNLHHLPDCFALKQILSSTVASTLQHTIKVNTSRIYLKV